MRVVARAPYVRSFLHTAHTTWPPYHITRPPTAVQPSGPSPEIQGTLDAIVNVDARIIALHCFPSLTRRFFCEALHRGLVGSKYQYILPGTVVPPLWWKREPGVDQHNCTDDELKQATQGYLSTSWTTNSPSTAVLPGPGGTAPQWRARYAARAKAMGVTTIVFGASIYDVSKLSPIHTRIVMSQEA